MELKSYGFTRNKNKCQHVLIIGDLNDLTSQNYAKSQEIHQKKLSTITIIKA